jgi:ATP/maltotriose-dependent transcriptional regulator MalT/DNA-binding SARP family transcriptional activator
MGTEFIAPAKIIPPKMTGTLQRKRLFRTLDDVSAPLVWITGPPGSGKTTLVASYLDARRLPSLWYQADHRDADVSTLFYFMGLAAKKAAPRFRKPLPLLTPEYLQGITAFTLRYFETLYRRLRTPHALVFDSCQEVPADAPFHEALREGLSNITDGFRAFLISRADPPAPLSSLLDDGTMAVLGWDDIRFTLAEAKALMRTSARGAPPGDIVRQAHERTDGWAAGLVLCMHAITREGASFQAPGQSPHDLPFEEVFKYFASEIFEKTDRETQEFLLKTAFLPRMTVGMAARLTGDNRADRILSGLSERRYFTVNHAHGAGDSVYQYLPIFREFLMSHAAQMLEHSDMCGMRRNAAELLDESGQVEDAAELLHAAGDTPGLVRLVLKHAEAFIVHGRHQVLKKWFSWLPDDAVESDPWLLYWSSLCHLPVNPRTSQTLSEKAYELHRARGDDMGMFLSCYPAVGAVCYEQADFKPLDRWIAVLDTLFRKAKTPLSPEVEARLADTMFVSLLLRQPHHPDIEAYGERLLRITPSLRDTNLRVLLEADLSMYYIWMGRYTEASDLIHTLLVAAGRKKAEVSPLAISNLLTYQAMYCAFAGLHEECGKAAAKGLEFMRASGVVVMEGQLMTHAVAGALGAGDLQTASRMLQNLEGAAHRTQRVVSTYFHLMKAWHALLGDDIPTSFHHIRVALDIASSIGFVLLEAIAEYGMAEVLFRLGEHWKSKTHLTRFHRIGRTLKSGILEFMYLLTEARHNLREGMMEAAHAHLRRALSLGKKQGYYFHLFWQPSVAAGLCTSALEAGIEVEYVQELIRRRKLLPDSTGQYADDWPWPIKVHTLGGFSLLTEGKPVPISGKAQKKPLDMLKAIISLGGGEAGEAQITDALWPDAAGDRGHKSFEITLHRLRKLCGTEKGIVLQDGKLSLDPRYCWVDAWALEKRIGEAEAEWKRVERLSIWSGQEADMPGESEAAEITEKAVDLYAGHYLPADAGQPWTVSYRERLRSKYIRMILKLGSYLEQSRQTQKAVECYQKGLEVDALAEEFYQRLMLCYQRLGQQAAGLVVYRRCSSSLKSELGMPPSSKTEAIRRSLQSPLRESP